MQIVSGYPLSNVEGVDKITSTDKITSPYFVDSITQLNASSIVSTSVHDTNEKYYFGISKDNVTGSVQFHATYGNVNGYGANTDGGNIKSETETIYKQWANLLLKESEVTGGFFISKAGSSAAQTGQDSEIFVLVGQRSLMGDRLNKKNWTIVLSGSVSSLIANNTGSLLALTDDSNTTAATSTPAGPRYNIVSGSQGSVAKAASVKTYGWFYPDQGALVFSAAELSESLPGVHEGKDVAVVYESGSQNGFGTTTSVDANYRSALRFVNCLRSTGAYLRFRDESDITSVSYFCRVRAAHANFSNNPTFVSGSLNEIRQETMRGNPTVFITGIQLYDGAGNMVATGHLSTPLKKNFSSEATIKVKLTY